MAVKRLLSVVLSALMIFASFATVSAAQSAISADVKAKSDNAYVMKITVIVPTTVTGTMTLQITDASETPTKLYAMSDIGTYEEDDGVRKYTAEITMPEKIGGEEVLTGNYYLWYGNNVEKDYYEFNYTSLQDKIDFYNGLIDAIDITEEEADAGKNAADEVGTYLADPETKCTAELADLESYEGLSDAVKGKVNTMLVNMQIDDETDDETDDDLAYIYGTEHPTTKNTTTGDNDALFIPAFSAAIDLAVIADASSEEWSGIAEEAMSGEGTVSFDDKYYTVPEGAEEGTKAVLDIVEDIKKTYSYFKAEIASLETLDATELSKAFDKATLLVIADTRNSTFVEEAFLYYEGEGKNSIAVDNMTNIKALVEAEKDADLWEDLKESGYTDAATLVANAQSIAQQMVEDGVLEETPIGDVGGSPTIDRPTKPGSTAPSKSDVAIKPAEPVNPTQPDPVEGFVDLAQAEWSREAVEYLADAGVINGKSENSFAPNDAVTREEGAKIIVAAFDLLNDADCEFTDVAADRWSYAYIAAAVEAGIITGYGDSFGPTDTMTREQAATIIYRAAEKIALELSGEKAEFTDGADTADWAADAIAHLAADGVINGMGDGTFAPKATLTRAQLAQLVYNVLVSIGGVK